jgi:hypothetical protein
MADMDSVFICSNIGDVCACGAMPDYLCDATRSPWDIREVRIIMSNTREIQREYDEAGTAERRLIEQNAHVLNAEIQRLVADPKTGTCSEPICAACAFTIGEDKHLCPTHAEDWQRARAKQEQHRAALIARGPGVFPADGWIVWGKVAHFVSDPAAIQAKCGRRIGKGWRPAKIERRCDACSVKVSRLNHAFFAP